MHFFRDSCLVSGRARAARSPCFITRWWNMRGAVYCSQTIHIFIQIFHVMKNKYRWGILAPGKMAAKFTRGLKLLDNASCMPSDRAIQKEPAGLLKNSDLKKPMEAMKSWLPIGMWILFTSHRPILSTTTTLCCVSGMERLSWLKRHLPLTAVRPAR